MYGRPDAVAPSSSGGGGRGGASRRVLPPGMEPETVAAAQELASKPVAELLAATGGGGGASLILGGGGDVAGNPDSGTNTAFGEAPRSVGASRLSDDSDAGHDFSDEDSRTVSDLLHKTLNSTFH